MITPNISLSYGENCELIIQDLTEYDDNLRYEDSVAFDYIIYHKLDSDNVVDGPYIFNRTINQNQYFVYGVEPIIVPLKYVGWITVVHIILPKSGDDYHYDGTLKFGEEVISNDDLLTQALINNSTLNTINLDFVNYCQIEKCYIDLCKQAIENHDCNSCINNKGNVQVLKLFLQAIKIMSELGRLEQAQELIESLVSCNGFGCETHFETCNCV